MKLLIFDIDGTLTDTKKADDECFIEAFQEKYAIVLPEVNWAAFRNVTDWGLFSELYSSHFQTSPSDAEMADFRRIFLKKLENKFKNSPAAFQEVKGAIQFLKHCANLPSLKVAFATGSWRHSAIFKLMTCDIPYQNIILSNSDNFISRQEIVLDAIAQAKELYGLTFFEKIVYFGDGEWDFHTTRLLAIPFIGVDVGHDEKLKKLGTKYVFSDFWEIDAVMAAVEKVEILE